MTKPEAYEIIKYNLENNVDLEEDFKTAVVIATYSLIRELVSERSEKRNG